MCCEACVSGKACQGNIDSFRQLTNNKTNVLVVEESVCMQQLQMGLKYACSVALLIKCVCAVLFDHFRRS